MSEQLEYSVTEQERAARRAERVAARAERERKRRKKMILQIGMVAGVCAALVLTVGAGLAIMHGFGGEEDRGELTPEKPEVPVIMTPQEPTNEEPAESYEEEIPQPFSLAADDRTVTIGSELSSKHAIVIDLTGETILAQKDADTIISPASMTKILTLLVAVEHAENLDDTVVIDLSITDYCYVNECSVAGFNRDEAVTVRDLLYGLILPSGAEAALALANYTAGSHEAFVELMNEKVVELGLSETAHFTNCVGLYHKENVCTVYDIAMILRAAMENELCREVLTTKIYEIPANEEHPEGMILSNWFLRRIEDYVPDGMEVIGAKTGYVSQAGNCAASIARTEEGAYFICVTANTGSSKQCVQDHVQLYTTYMGY